MNREALGVAWYRFRATLHRRWGGYLAVVLLVGLVGGVAVGAVGAARRTQSAFPAALATTDASDLDVQIGTVGGYALNAVSVAQQRAHLPGGSLLGLARRYRGRPMPQGALIEGRTVPCGGGTFHDWSMLLYLGVAQLPRRGSSCLCVSRAQTSVRLPQETRGHAEKRRVTPRNPSAASGTTSSAWAPVTRAVSIVLVLQITSLGQVK